MVYTPICFPSTDSGMGNPIIGSVCNEVESQTFTHFFSHPRTISHGSTPCRCSFNELEDTVDIPPPTLLPRVLEKAQWDQGELILITRYRPQAIWFPLLLGMLVQSPLRIPNNPWLLSQPRGQIHRDPSNLQLHTWRVSGMSSTAEAFRSTLPHVSVDPSESLL